MMKKSKEFFNTTIFYSLPALWKATPKERKIEHIKSLFPLAIAFIIASPLSLYMGHLVGNLSTAIAFLPIIFVLIAINFNIAFKDVSLLPVFAMSRIYPDSLIRTKYLSAEWKGDTILIYIEDNHENQNEMSIEQFLNYFQGQYKLFYREEGIMGKAEVQIEPSQIKELQFQLTPLQIEMEIQKDGTVAICLDHREERWYDDIKSVKRLVKFQEEITDEHRDTK